MTGYEWELDAACRDDPNPGDWFEGARRRDVLKRTLRVCFSCPVRDECLASHLARERVDVEPIGTAGGMTAPARKRLLEQARS